MATRPEAWRVAAPAKINLCLHVLRKRADGYHDLQSLVAFTHSGDVLTLRAAERFSLEIEGPFASQLADDPDNLVLRAARKLAAELGRKAGAAFTLTKNLPVASGIGGGSADAGAALRGLLELWAPITLAPERLNEIAAQLGSDIPVCVPSRPAWMEGRGERVSGLPPLPEAHLVLVNPGIAVPTAEVFRRLRIAESDAESAVPDRFASFAALTAYLETTRNDLEAPACEVAPVIGDVLAALRRSGAALARMSGSGATCFGLYPSPAAAEAARRRIVEEGRGWWCAATALLQGDEARPAALAQ